MRYLIQLIFRCLVFLKQETDLCSRVFLFPNVSHSRSILTKTERKYYFVVFLLFYYMCVCTFLPSEKKSPKFLRKNQQQQISKHISRSSVSQTAVRDDRTSRLIQLKYRKIKSMLLKSHILSIISPLFLNSNWKFECSVRTGTTDTISETFRSPQLNN